MTGVILQTHDGGQTLAMLEQITDFYEEIHAENPGNYTDEKFSQKSFVSRTTSQAQATGFSLITATLEGDLIGFSFGYSFSPGQWWRDCTPAPEEVLESSKLAVIELNVRSANRRQGIGKNLLDELLSGRTEQLATLSVRTGSAANAMYLRRGWHKVGHFITPPPMDALVIPLPLRAG